MSCSRAIKRPDELTFNFTLITLSSKKSKNKPIKFISIFYLYCYLLIFDVYSPNIDIGNLKSLALMKLKDLITKLCLIVDQ